MSSPQKFQTPPPRKNRASQRQREGIGRIPTTRHLISHSSCSGSTTSSPAPSNCSSTISQPPNKTVYLIRHGESLGQIADRKARKYDSNLIDCGLSPQGKWQAREMLPELLGKDIYNSIELVVSSPLTRALETAVTAFPGNKPIMVHYQLREIGNMIPENIPRNIEVVLQDLKSNGYNIEKIDAVTLQPDQWPRRHDTPPKVVRRDRIRQAFEWMTAELEHVSTIAVVCHYHVIRAALEDFAGANSQVKPQNATPIRCHLYPDGRLIMTSNISDTNV